MLSNKTQTECYQDFLGLMIKGRVPDEILYLYLHNHNNDDGSAFESLQRFIALKMRDEIVDWATAEGIIDSADRMYQCALENGNVKQT